MSQHDVATATGITQPRIAQIELGKINLTIETVARIAVALGREPAALLALASS